MLYRPCSMQHITANIGWSYDNYRKQWTRSRNEVDTSLRRKEVGSSSRGTLHINIKAAHQRPNTDSKVKTISAVVICRFQPNRKYNENQRLFLNSYAMTNLQTNCRLKEGIWHLITTFLKLNTISKTNNNKEKALNIDGNKYTYLEQFHAFNWTTFNSEKS